MSTKVLNIAHRGARGVAPENTIGAARKALELGADMWELDVSITADGQLVLMHDDSLVRTTNAQAIFPERTSWDCSDFTLAELQTLDAGLFYLETDPFGQIKAGHVADDDQAIMRGEPIPTLETALRFTRDHNWQVNVEIKQLPASVAAFPVVEKTVTLIQQLDMVDRVLLSSFDHAYLKQARALDPKLAIGALAYEPLTVDLVPYLTDLQCQAYHPYYEYVEADQVDMLRQAGFDVNIWTVNEIADMQSFIKAGVTGIITDFPQRLNNLL